MDHYLKAINEISSDIRRHRLKHLFTEFQNELISALKEEIANRGIKL